VWNTAVTGLAGGGLNAYLRLRKWQAMRAARRKPAAFATLRPEFLWIESEGRKLACHFVRGEPGRGVWLLAHGLGENRWQMAARAQWFRGRGCSVMLFDFRAHGESDWGPCGFGALETADVEAAAAFLQDEIPGEKISFCGMSQGAAAGVLSAAAPGFERMVLEGLYRTVEDAILLRGERWIPLLGRGLAAIYAAGAVQGSPLNALRALGRPTLLIAGERDPYVPLAHARELAEAARASLAVFPGLKHVNFHRRDPERWERSVLDFLETPPAGIRPCRR
jgi:pimeloyl-ACP methyl ester carboxylesterase